METDGLNVDDGVLECSAEDVRRGARTSEGRGHRYREVTALTHTYTTHYSSTLHLHSIPLLTTPHLI